MIDRIAIFGDSMSDLGRKKDTGSGILARFLHLMRVNEVGRYSDSKNWADYLWEWSGGTSFIDNQDKKTTDILTKNHFSLDNSTHGSVDGKFSFVNYAVGGAIIGESEKISGKMGLTLLDKQKKEYLKQFAKEDVHPERTLHIIWAGLNDTVTDEKKPEQMEQLAAKIREFTDDTRKVVEKDGRQAYFMIVNNPDPKEAVRYVNQQDRPLLLEAQKANDELNEYLRLNFENAGGNIKFVDMNELLKSSNLSQLHLIKAAQSKGMKVQYQAPDEVDASLVGTLKKFKEMYGQTEEGKKIWGRIEEPLKTALRTDNEKPLHKTATEVVIESIRENHTRTGNISEEIKFISDALMVNGTYAEQLDFATKYYETAYNGKSQADIDRIRGEINKIAPKQQRSDSDKITSKDFNLLKDTKDDLYASHTDLYDAVSRVLDETKDPEFRRLIEDITANNLGFVATSDQAHPTERAHRVIALQMASSIIEAYGETPGHNFIRNVQTAFGDSEIFSEYKKANSSDERIPFSNLVEELPSANEILMKMEQEKQQQQHLPQQEQDMPLQGILRQPNQMNQHNLQVNEISQAVQQNQSDINEVISSASASPVGEVSTKQDITDNIRKSVSFHPDVTIISEMYSEAGQSPVLSNQVAAQHAQENLWVQTGQMPSQQLPQGPVIAQQMQVAAQQMQPDQMPQNQIAPQQLPQDPVIAQQMQEVVQQMPPVLPVQAEQILAQQMQPDPAVNLQVQQNQLSAQPVQPASQIAAMDLNAFAVPVVQQIAQNTEVYAVETGLQNGQIKTTRL